MGGEGWVRIISACMCFVIFSLVFRPVVSRRCLFFVIILLSADRTGGALGGGGGGRRKGGW